MDDHFRPPPVGTEPLGVTTVEGEIVIDAGGNALPSLTPAAARTTGERLIAAADKADPKT